MKLFNVYFLLSILFLALGAGVSSKAQTCQSLFQIEEASISTKSSFLILKGFLSGFKNSEMTIDNANIVADHFFNVLKLIDSTNLNATPSSTAVQEGVLLITTGIDYKMTLADKNRIQKQYELMPEKFNESLKERLLNAILPEMSLKIQQQILVKMLLNRINEQKIDLMVFNKMTEGHLNSLRTKRIFNNEVIVSRESNNHWGNQLVPLMIASGFGIKAQQLIEAGAPLDGLISTDLLKKASNGKIEVPIFEVDNRSYEIENLSALDIAGLIGDMHVFDALIESGAKPMLYRLSKANDGALSAKYVSSVGFQFQNSNWHSFARLFNIYKFEISHTYLFEPTYAHTAAIPSTSWSWAAPAVTVRPSEFRRNNTYSLNANRQIINIETVALNAVEIMSKAINDGQLEVAKLILHESEKLNLKHHLHEKELSRYLEIVGRLE